MRKLIGYIVVILLIVLVIPVKEFKPVVGFEQQFKSKVASWTSGTTTSNKPLKVPSKQAFAVNNIQMNMDKSTVTEKLGKPKHITTNEYGTKWYTYYSDDYRSFVMVSYIDNKVNGLYSNQNVISSKSKIKYGTPKSTVRDRLGTPITEIRKGHTNYEIEDDEYDTFHDDQIYTTAFYDKHSDNNLTAILQVSERMESRLQQQYGAPSDELAHSFELQNFDLVNAERVQHELPTLKYSESISDTARKHSEDMANKNYFDHTDLAGNSPFDRLEADGHDFSAAGENLAYGQTSSIYAHQGLMNSLGHRKNILKRDFNTLGVGVEFNNNRQPYWTENYTG
ncbi:secretion protein [Staphylococcus gallinarum]|nr:CAP domain-containing protein [Staphylococcus gallinarum]MCD8793054.1 CAP domain-containing protein [Staphylococcus gallinarum]MCD8917002.1 CAP domain-containing protein [Staphylococcus gallinarum]PTE32213.1 secretion protein [Staphylococcus gallinarum]PTK90349.1 secretion protein [Staphylococcus gallinarum]RIL20152.1 CAP domain-containing protein [Staphylococcus gallinarum]